MTREFGEKTNRGRVELWSCGAVELVLRKQCNEGSLLPFQYFVLTSLRGLARDDEGLELEAYLTLFSIMALVGLVS
jgi:hypothetical protein